MSVVGVIGSGSWGTALSKVLCENGHDVMLWSFEKENAQLLAQNLENKEFLPNIKLPKELKHTYSIEEVVKDKEFIIYATPSGFVRSTMEIVSPYLKDGQIIVSVAKGFEDGSLLRLSQVIEELAPNCHVGTLSGPSHAEEVGLCMPTTIVASSKNIKIAEEIQDLFMNPYLRIYVNTDTLGVEVGGALKNIIALAAGMVDGLGYGDNTIAALMTRGLTEISRLGIAMGADPTTFFGLTGIGDLIVTCTSEHSRNRRCGILLGKGYAMEKAVEEVHMVVEGISCTKAAHTLASKYNVEMPITNEIYKVLFENGNVKEAVYRLMSRGATREHSREDLLN